MDQIGIEVGDDPAKFNQFVATRQRRTSRIPHPNLHSCVDQTLLEALVRWAGDGHSVTSLDLVPCQLEHVLRDPRVSGLCDVQDRERSRSHGQIACRMRSTASGVRTSSFRSSSGLHSRT